MILTPRKRIIIALVAPGVLAASIVSFFLYYSLLNNALERWQSDNKFLINTLIEHLQSNLSTSVGILKTASEQPAFSSLPYLEQVDRSINGIPETLDQEKRKVFEAIRKNLKDFSVLFILSPNGDHYISHPFSVQKSLKRFNLSSRPYFIEATNTKDAVVSDSFVGADGVPAVAIDVPVIGTQGEIVSHIGGVFHLSKLSQLLQAKRISPFDKSFIVDRKGALIAHTDIALLTSKGRDTFSQHPLIAQYLGKTEYMKAPAVQFYTDATSGTEYIASTVSLNNGWLLTLMREKQSIVESVQGQVLKVSGVSFILFIGIGFVGFIMTSRITRKWELAEHRLKDAHDNLETRVIERTEALADSERRFRHLFENSEVAIWSEDFSDVYEHLNALRENGIKDLRSHLLSHPDLAWDIAALVKVTHVNEATLHLFGTSSESEFLFEIDKTFGPNAIDTFIDELCAIWNGETFFRGEAQFRKLTGEIIHAIVSFHIPSKEEDLKAIPVSLIDISDRIEAETQLILAKDDAEKANHSKSEFLASMSHELRTPLNAVLGFAQMLQYDPSQELSNSQNDHVQNIIAGGEHLLQLVNQILDLARIEADQVTLELEDVDAKTVLNTCVELVEPLAAQRNIAIDIDYEKAQETLIRTDPIRFKQVILNLLSNAIKFNRDGRCVSIHAKESGDGFLRISVVDEGIGISKEDSEKVFQVFHRLNADPHITQEGTGIGLAVTKLLVERMAGRIGLDSQLNVGSTFWVELPLASNQEVFIWTQELALGIDQLDKDHQGIINLINRISLTHLTKDEFQRVTEELMDHTRCHIEREELVMEVCGYPEYEEHKQYHADLVESVEQLLFEWRQNSKSEALHKLRTLLRNWWLNHIQYEDMKIARCAEGKMEEINKALKEN